MSSGNKRFEALDSWRGISACFVAFFHLMSIGETHLDNVGFIKNSYIFVDFFFVLSGFVIASSYQQKLLGGLRLRDYIFLRLGRIYPLHLFVLLLFVLFECSKFFLPTKSEPFGHEMTGWWELASNLLLVHSLGVFDHLSWNTPSWSISVEFYTYLLYAYGLYVFRERLWIVALVFVAVTPAFFLAIGKENMDITYDLGFLRCLYGFSAGILVHKIRNIAAPIRESGTRLYAGLEILVTVAIVIFLVLYGAGTASFFAPFLFAATVLIFSFEAGIVSVLLKKPLFLLLGQLSYSIYMIHVFIQLAVVNLAKLLEKKFGLHFFVTDRLSAEGIEILGRTAWESDLWLLATFGFVLVGAFITYRLIENPCNAWCRRYIKQKTNKNVPQGTHAAF